jgi:predicted glycosyltransferase
VKVWIDMTASAHVLVFRPLIRIMRERGDDVQITARDYAQTLQLLELHGLEADAVLGHHGGRSRTGKARALTSRLHALRGWARDRELDVALTHGSHELTITARRLGIPSSTTFDYEWAWLQHQLGSRAATKVVIPEAIPPERMARYGVEPPKLVRYQGLKEEYYLSDFEPNPDVAASFALDPQRVLIARRRTYRSTTVARTRCFRRRSSSSAAGTTCTRSSCRASRSSASSWRGSNCRP